MSINDTITKKTETAFFNFLSTSQELASYNIYDSTGQNNVQLPCIIVSCSTDAVDDSIPDETGCRVAQLIIYVETKASRQNEARRIMDDINGCLDALMSDEQTIQNFTNLTILPDMRVQQGYHVYDVTYTSSQEQFEANNFKKEFTYTVYCAEHSTF